ncbi:hypothetical protein P43SY_005005 [Pythium insidiosum]|uniref:Uncharacterized protein n=1 Tax=Pythium insidiosum TaxID=114742 RepID=A0AAD5M9Z8_PYTIN|nr:hypothetical protein P43SY_005005 [Pythium insidiosum]KAJ0411907.1 hypothetical protein ATCC90586_006002 [Pythium insidiosum]
MESDVKAWGYREIMALFHAAPARDDAATWEALWQAALADAREQQRQELAERKRQKKREQADGGASSAASTPTRGSGASSGGRLPAAVGDKRPRPPSLPDTDANKASRRAPNQRPKGAGSKLLQKLGSRGS